MIIIYLITIWLIYFLYPETKPENNTNARTNGDFMWFGHLNDDTKFDDNDDFDNPDW